jgi:hypothetical protein
MSSAGWPYLERTAWEQFRDGVPHLLGLGAQLFDLVTAVEAALDEGCDPQTAEGVRRASRVVRQVVHTAAITAPPDLWLIRHVLGFFAELGLLERLRLARPSILGLAVSISAVSSYS